MEKNDIAAKIEALLNKTVQNGATEDEAFAAMKAAKKLMDKYGMSEDDLKNAQKDDFVFLATEFDNQDINSRVALVVSSLAEVKVFTQRNEQGKRILVFFGFETDVKFAKHVMEVVYHFHKKGWKQFLKTSDSRGYSAHRTFTIYYASRIRARIEEFINSNKIEFKSTGTGLIVLKDQIVTQELASRIQLQKARVSKGLSKKTKENNAEAAWAGYESANNASLILKQEQAAHTPIG